MRVARLWSVEKVGLRSVGVVQLRLVAKCVKGVAGKWGEERYYGEADGGKGDAGELYVGIYWVEIVDW